VQFNTGLPACPPDPIATMKGLREMAVRGTGWTINAARQGSDCQFTLSNVDGIAHGPFVVGQAEALSLAGMIQGLYGGTSSASVTATAAPPRPRKAASRGRRG
jgi:hypothetical protein